MQLLAARPYPAEPGSLIRGDRVFITMEVDAAEGGAGDSAGTSERQARQAGAWNRHDDAAVAGILAAARAAGAKGASVRYGEAVTKIWFESQDSEPPEVKEQFRELHSLVRQSSGSTNWSDARRARLDARRRRS